MPFLNLFLLFAAISWLLYLLVSTLLAYKKLKHIKGPWLASISPFWMAYHAARGEIHLAASRALHKYGSPVRIAPNVVVTDDPALIKLLLGPRKAGFRRGPWYSGMKIDPRINNVLSTQDEKAHAELRSKLIAGYSGKEVPTLESDIDGQVVNLIALIQREYIDKSQSFDFATLASYFTLDSLTCIAFGAPCGFLVQNKDLYGYCENLEAFLPILELACNHPKLRSLLHNKFVQSISRPDKNTGLGKIMEYAREAVSQQSGPDGKVRDDMIGSFIKHGLTTVQCESESVIVILAGSDSTSTALRTTFFYIVSSPTVFAKLRSEVNNAVASGRISSPIIKLAEAQALPYLQACIKEGLRIFPPLIGLATHVALEDVRVGNTFIPAGTEVTRVPTETNRLKEVWGPDADTFRPERWLEADEQTLKTYERLFDITFGGSGRFACLGKQIALTEMSKTLFELVNHFDFTLVNPLQGVKMRANGTVTQKGMVMRAWMKR